MAVARQMKSPAFEKRVLEEAVPHSRVAHAHVDRIEPMSVFRVWLLFATLGLLALLVAISVVFGILAGTGVLSAGERLLASGGVGHHFRFSLAWILTRFGLGGCVLVVLSAALAACGAMIYNAVAGSFGGLEITLRDRRP